VKVVKGVVQRVPLVAALEYIPAKGRIGEYHNSPLTFPLGMTEIELINRMFFGISPVEDAGRDRVFDLTIQRWTLEDGSWYVHLLFKPSRRKTPLARCFVVTKGRREDGDISLSHNGLLFWRILKVDSKEYAITCGACGKRCYTAHGFNPRFARTNKEARQNGKTRWICPDCLERPEKKVRKQSRRPRRELRGDSRQLRHLRSMARK
jgi:hypothetical protein